MKAPEIFNETHAFGESFGQLQLLHPRSQQSWVIDGRSSIRIWADAKEKQCTFLSFGSKRASIICIYELCRRVGVISSLVSPYWAD